MTMLTKAMKIKIGTAAAVLAAALTSCVSNEVAQPVSEDIPITYSVLQKSMATRAAVTGTTYPQNVPFGSFAYYLPSGQTWPDNKSKAQLYINNNKIEYYLTGEDTSAPNSWHSNIVHYWPKTGTLTFFSYSPYENDELQSKISCSPDNGLKIDSWTAAMNPGDAAEKGTGVDLMIAQSVNQSGTSSATASGYHSGVPTEFHHICCQVEVRAKLDNPDENADYKVNSITLNNMWTVANFSNGEWSGHKTFKDVFYTLEDSSGALNKDGMTPTVVFPPMIVIPQNLQASEGRQAPGITINYTYKEDNVYKTVSVLKEFVKDINGLVQAWEKGKKYIFTIVFSTDDAFIEFGTSVDGWGSDNSSSITVGQ